jgi:hypothetical protein
MSSMQRVVYGMLVSIGALSAALGGCSGGGSASQSTDSASTATGPLQVACEIHYYNASGLPAPTILVAAQNEGTAGDFANPTANPLSLATPDGVTAWVGMASGKLSVEVLAASGSFVASGAYTVPATKAFTTDLQAPLTPPVTKDGVTYDRLWVGCSRSTGSSTDAGAFVPPPVETDAGIAAPDASVGGPGGGCHAQDGLRCVTGYACTYDYGASIGICQKPGALGGLCGATYADFSGGDCDPGLHCDLGTAAFPGGSPEATYLPSGTGICRDANGAADAGAGD